MDRERDIERYLRHRVEQMGGLAFKFVAPGNDGVPDRMVVIPGRVVAFVELKTDGGELSPIQVWQQERLKRRGCIVATLWSKDQVDEWLQDMRGGDAR